MSSYQMLIVVLLQLAGTVVSDDKTPSYTTDCVQLNGTLSLNITYATNDGKGSSFLTTVSKTAKPTSQCGNITSNIRLTDEAGILTIEFSVNKKKTAKNSSVEAGHWGVTKVSYEYDVEKADAIKMGRRVAVTAGTSYLVTPLNVSYSCSKEVIELANVTTTNNGSVVLETREKVALNSTHLAVSIGPIQPQTAYDYHYCKADQKIKDIVPIAVGVALAALVIIVLVAYLIGRRRTVAAGGYERV